MAVGHLTNDRADLALQTVQPLLDDEVLQREARQLSAIATKRQGQVDDAIILLEELVTDSPGFSQAWYNLGVCYGEVDQRLAAIVCYQTCLRGVPDHADAMWNLADALRLDEQFEQALLLFQRLQSAEPYNRKGDLYHRMAVCLMYLGRSEEATQVFEEALLLGTTDTHTTMWESSHAHLLTERFDIGWLAYEHRFAAGNGSGVVQHEFDIPIWNGQQLNGGSLLIHGEQGLGDQIMFASIIPELANQKGNLILAVHPSLVNLFQASFPDQTVVAHTPDCPMSITAFPNIDWQVAIASLASYRRPSVASFAAVSDQPYLDTQPQRRSFFADLLDEFVPDRATRRTIGVVWGANPCHGSTSAARRSRQKSLPVQQLKEFAAADPSAVFVSLQNHEVALEAGGCAAAGLIDCHRYLNSMHDTAALAANLDLIISVDTGVAHLAGGLGVPLWLLLMQHADWRWGRRETDCLWYASARLFRQKQQGDWSTVVHDVSCQLATTASARQ